MTTSGDLDVPAASATFAMVGLAILGGLACAAAITFRSVFAAAVGGSPLCLAWSTLVVANGALAWSGFLPALWAARRLGNVVGKTARAMLGRTLATVVAVLVAYATIVPSTYELRVTWPLGLQHPLRVGIITGVILLPTVVAVLAMWLAVARADELTKKVSLVPKEISDYLELRGILQGFLWFIGAVIGVAVLSTGLLRQSMLAASWATEETYPAPLVLAYGAFFTLVLAICYVPAHAMMLRAGGRIQAAFLAKAEDVPTWSEERKKLSELLGLDLSVDKSLKDTIAILAPLVAGFVSNALPGASD